MAKKSGMSLNPGADATLVAAAYRAGMANVPKDLSGTFESLAKSYDATMKSLGESFSNVIEKVGPLAVGMVKNAIKKDSLETKYKGDMINRPASFGDEGVLSEKDWEEQNKMTDPSSDKGTYQEYLDNVGTKMSIGDLFTNIRDEEISLKGKNDPKSKKRIQELKAEKQQIYNELDFLAKADQTNVNLLKSGMVDEVATGQSNMVLSAAIQQYSTSSGKIQEGPYKGYYVDLGDNADKEFTFTLKAPNGDIVTGENIDGTLQTGGKKPISVASSGVADLFVTKYSQENINGINKALDPLLKLSGTPYGSINVINKIKPFVSNENDLHGAMQTALGSHPTSFFEELKTTSPTSAAYFASLSSVTLKKLGVTDTDGDGFIGDNPNTEKVETGDFASEANYAKVRSKLLDRSNPNYSFRDTQTAFLNYADSVGQKMHNYKPTVINNKNNQTTGGSNGIAWGNTYKPFSEQDTKIDDALAGKDLYDWENNRYTTKDGGATYSPVEANSLYSAGQNIPTNDLLSGGQFGLSHRIGNNKFGESSGGGAGGGGAGGGENPFGGTVANQAPDEFIAAVDQGEEDTIAYLEGMGIKVKDKFGDKVEVEINGQTKTFRVDPYLGNDASIANKMWKWMFENWNTKQEFKVGEVYERGGKNYTYNEDGTFTEK